MMMLGHQISLLGLEMEKFGDLWSTVGTVSAISSTFWFPANPQLHSAAGFQRYTGTWHRSTHGGSTMVRLYCTHRTAVSVECLLQATKNVSFLPSMFYFIFAR